MPTSAEDQLKAIIRAFSFLNEDQGFRIVKQEEGGDYAEVYYRDDSLLIRSSSQREVNKEGMYYSHLVFFLDPSNESRWCLLEGIVEELTGHLPRSDEENLDSSAALLREHLSAIRELARSERGLPFESFEKPADDPGVGQ